ncbi:hypothetical protein AJ79_04064 [Helicocarpus griseus UAMH5409]|uniref:Uncharacterized protein n=1 Tax=Helicocarpus griseus UAMH5409 TaxID=1447875 RepID=A0A2B7XLS4_9EURO|nr:hypothetical protein AJ79_04064 [Helicocarpus griseus UAMH5409]
MKFTITSLATLLLIGSAAALPPPQENFENRVKKACDTPCYQDCASYCPIQPPGAAIGCSIACLDICGCA